MVTIKLKESEVFRIMTGSLEDRVSILISESVMSKMDLNTIKDIVEKEIEQAKKKSVFDDDKLTEVIKVFQLIAYNRDKSPHSEEIATYIFDKLFEIICHDFW